MNHGLASWSMEMLLAAKTRVEALGADVAQAPDEWHQLYNTASASLMSGAGVRGFTYLLILLLVGFSVEWLYWIYAYGSWRALQSSPASTPRQALRLGLRRLMLQSWGLLLFAAATIGASAAFTWPAGVQEVVIASTLLLLVLRLAWVAVVTLLAPGRPQLRLVPVAPRKARWLAIAVMSVVCLLALGRFLPEILERVAGARHVAGGLKLLMFSAAALLLFVTAGGFIDRRTDAGEVGSRRSLPRFPRAFVAAMLIVAVYAVWLISPAAALIAAVAAVVIALQLALRELVFFFWEGEADPGVLPSIVLSAARFVVVLIGLGACALALEAPIASLLESESATMRLGLRALGVATLALLTNVLWIAVRTTIDQRLERIRPSAAAHDEPDANARLLTLLPLLRVTTAVLLTVMLVLSSLWALGIEITPLLAGAGVVGLALGFGAQALVRDVIAGVFFLAEDAFRIGEYIESGSSTKGTVERISLRTVALRHHNGPLHFVPYGALGSVRNTSRDWVIEKFNLPLPIGADSEKIRKMIKKIGEEMMADPEVGPLMMEPLKGKLYRVDPGVKIFRCGFRTAPGKQFDVRAQALKRIEAALKAMGVSFADGTQIVVVQPSPPAA